MPSAVQVAPFLHFHGFHGRGRLVVFVITVRLHAPSSDAKSCNGWYRLPAVPAVVAQFGLAFPGDICTDDMGIKRDSTQGSTRGCLDADAGMRTQAALCVGSAVV